MLFSECEVSIIHVSRPYGLKEPFILSRLTLDPLQPSLLFYQTPAKMDSTEIHQTTVVDEPMTDAFSDNLADQGDLEAPLKTEEEYSVSELTLRAIVSSKEAGVIIGKAGKNVADLRDETGVKAGVSKVVPGVHDRVLTITGQLRSLARAYAIVAKGLLEGAPQMGMGGIVSNNGTHRK